MNASAGESRIAIPAGSGKTPQPSCRGSEADEGIYDVRDRDGDASKTEVAGVRKHEIAANGFAGFAMTRGGKETSPDP
jgi:hypothetical protein